MFKISALMDVLNLVQGKEGFHNFLKQGGENRVMNLYSDSWIDTQVMESFTYG